jgi:RNA polymerase sigma factor (sigma-70 family)
MLKKPFRMRWPTTWRHLLAAMINERDHASWSLFCERYSAVLHQFCRARGLQSADADEVVQTVLIAVSRQISRFDYQPNRARFRFWLMKVLNRSIWKVRHRRREDFLAEPNGLEHPGGDDLLEFGEAVFEVAVQRVRPEFTREEWEVFERTWRRDEPHALVADALRRRISWVYRTKFKILHRLEEQVVLLSADIACPGGLTG